ncbi:MAG: GGDEF domain-containing protein [Clostridia bacterium]|nr:GGDEF domain-containing protein [Clostridia bacterium]
MQENENIIVSEERVPSGFRLEIFNFLIIVLTVIVVLSLSVIIFKAHETYEAFYDATEQYIVCRQSAEEVHDASDYLTDEVREFANTGDLSHIKNYFNEANITKRRESSINKIKKYDNSNTKNTHLESAVEFSQELMNIEYYSMRLVLEADGVPESKYPDIIKHTDLSAEDAALTNPEKRAKAKDLLYNNEYALYKEEIYGNVTSYTEDILSGTRERERVNSIKFTHYQNAQIVLVILLLGILTLNVSFTSIFMIRPLRKSSKLIMDQMSLPEKGATEMRTFAKLYNRVLEKTKIHQAALSYEASHDSLTGIHNRSAFDELYHKMHSTTNIALLIVDIDFFKEINDTYGHETGDNVLKKVAKLLYTSFRSDDTICRIGGDEFTVILRGINPNCKEQLENKLAFIMRKISEPNDSLPAFTLSIGVAFGNSKSTFKTLYKCADEALYKIKSSTKNGIEFYQG